MVKKDDIQRKELGIERLKILELFSGYGTASFALKQLGIDYEIIGYSDIAINGN